ncbi:VgrG-related protein [Streptomyces silvensis]|uniref:Type IV secretion protein Rhs n=1 Tax=Streptomyces silvensis TaxID=1765722 RepID=A0A0W7X852_9ACTN|nr:VgrG-related protein [Streptomyces silvensis]KUF18739.1 type IV secretion protein Rhs [Streptomyces silvensis]
MAGTAFSSIMKVQLGGSELPEKYARMLVDGWVDQGAGVPAAFRLTFRDPYRLLLKELNVKFGTPVVLTPVADGQGAGDPLLTGEVTALEADYDGTGSFTVIRGYDLGHRFLRRRRVAAYTNETASSIVRKLAGLAGVPVGTIESSRASYEFISQANVTDWDFIARLADENKMVMSLDAKGKFNFVSPKPSSGAPSPRSEKNPLVLKSGKDILRLRTSVTAADQVAEVEVRGYDVATAREIVETSTRANNPVFSIGTSPKKAAGAFKKTKLVQTSQPYDKRPEVKHAADALFDDVSSSFSELEVVVHGNPKLRPGVPVALAEVGWPFQGKYTTTSVRHVFGNGQRYESWVTVSGRQWRSLYGLTSGGAETEPRLPGVANAVVTDVDVKDEQARVKLKFPWLDDTYVSDWTRCVQLGGKRGGGIFPLDVGDEVLVGFDRGALDHPFVIGGLYNGKDKPTRNKSPLYSGARNQASRHTISDRTGNRIDLLSQRVGRDRGVRVTTGDGKLTVNLDRAKTEITVDSKGSVTIKGSRSVSVQAGTDLTLSAKRNVSIKSGGLLNIRAASAVNVNAGGGGFSVNTSFLNVRAAGLATVSAAGPLMLTSAASVGLTSSNINLTGAVLVNRKPLPF